jgi:hypothetical protein
MVRLLESVRRILKRKEENSKRLTTLSASTSVDKKEYRRRSSVAEAEGCLSRPPKVPAKDGPNPVPPAPKSPVPWSWTCHKCGSTYLLGVTRRCLRDGHYFCPSSDMDPKKLIKVCFSSFDYIGWQKANRWRKRVRRAKLGPIPTSLEVRGKKLYMVTEPVLHRNCWEKCDFPNACRFSNDLEKYREEVLK